MASVDEVRGILSVSAVPHALVQDLLSDPPALWLRGESPDVIAGDVAMCHPHLSADEVRISVSGALVPGALRVCVLAGDRPGLLAATAGALAETGLSIVQAAAMTWPAHGWALQRVLVVDPQAGSSQAVERDLLRARLRVSVRDSTNTAVPFVPARPVRVRVEAQPSGTRLVRVAAPDRVGLLWAISHWLEGHGCNVLVARAAPLGQLVDDAFLVDGRPDEAELSSYLTGERVPAGAG